MPKGTSTPSPERTIQDVLEAINTFATVTQKRFDTIDERFKEIDKRFEKNESRMNEMQSSIDLLITTTEEIRIQNVGIEAAYRLQNRKMNKAEKDIVHLQMKLRQA